MEQLADGLPLPGLGIGIDGGELAAVRVEGDTIRITTSVPAAAYGRYRNGTPIRKWLCHQEIAPER